MSWSRLVTDAMAERQYAKVSLWSSKARGFRVLYSIMNVATNGPRVSATSEAGCVAKGWGEGSRRAVNLHSDVVRVTTL